MRKKIFIALISILCISIAFLYISNKPLKNKQEAKYNQVITSQASWVKSYNSIDDLFPDAEFVVRGKVKENLPTYKINDTAFTDSVFEVADVLKGNLPEKTIKISQDGGVIDGIKFETENVKMLESGKEYILFLQLRFPPKREQFAILGGWKGQFELGVLKAENPEKNMSIDKSKLMEKIAKSK